MTAVNGHDDPRSSNLTLLPRISLYLRNQFTFATNQFISITKLLDGLGCLGSARAAGRAAGQSWGALAASVEPWAPWLARFGGPGRFWLALAGSIWPRVARSGCPGRSGWLALDALGAPGSPWLANDCPIDTISKKNRFAFRRSCFDAACFVRSGTFLHASKLVIDNYGSGQLCCSARVLA